MVNHSNADRMRRGISTLMTTLTGLCTLLAVGALLIILFYIAYRGIGSINLQFLIDRPRPVGEGGGIGNAILGSLVLLLISSAFGLPLGICVGIYLSEIGRGRVGGVRQPTTTYKTCSRATRAVLCADGSHVRSCCTAARCTTPGGRPVPAAPRRCNADREPLRRREA